MIPEAERRSLPLHLVALGGKRMQAAGAELIADTASIGAIGFWEALPLLLPTLKIQSRIDDFLKSVTKLFFFSALQICRGLDE